MGKVNAEPMEEPKKAQKEQPGKPYRVIKNLRYGGKHYNPGTTVELTAKDAKTLLALGTVAEPSRGEQEK